MKMNKILINLCWNLIIFTFFFIVISSVFLAGLWIFFWNFFSEKKIVSVSKTNQAKCLWSSWVLDDHISFQTTMLKIVKARFFSNKINDLDEKSYEYMGE